MTGRVKAIACHCPGHRIATSLKYAQLVFSRCGHSVTWDVSRQAVLRNSLQFHEEGQMSAWLLPLLSPRLTIQSGFPTNFRSPHPALTRAAGQHSEAPWWAA